MEKFTMYRRWKTFDHVLMIREGKQCIGYHLLFSHTINEFLVFDGNGTAAWYGNEGGQTQKVQNHKISLTLT